MKKHTVHMGEATGLVKVVLFLDCIWNVKFFSLARKVPSEQTENKGSPIKDNPIMPMQLR